jgi:4-hydroxybenzoate polyprenyltransferase
VLLGAAARASCATCRGRGLAPSSCCLYLAGMALNDYADREVDAVERRTADPLRARDARASRSGWRAR